MAVALRSRSASPKYDILPASRVSASSYYVPRRRMLWIVAPIALLSLAGVSLLTLVYDYSVMNSLRQSVATGASWLHATKLDSAEKPKTMAEPLVVGPPTLSFTENLRNETKYITTWTVAGWTNQIMTYINLLYLSSLTDRVPILPPFAGGFIPDEAGYMDFGVIFDVPRLVKQLNRDILEWNQVKNYSSPNATVDDLGCWSVWAMANRNSGHPAYSKVEQVLKIDVAYTPVPQETKLRQNDISDVHVSFWGMALLSFPDERARFVGNNPAKIGSRVNKHTLPPDDHLLCYDLLYYTGAFGAFEFEKDYSPAWRYVGRHVHWSAWVQNIGNSYIRRVLGVDSESSLPQYIAIHIRHNDFASTCKGANVALEDCFAPLSAYERRVAEVRAELQTSTTYNLSEEAAAALPVILTSDDTSREFIDSVNALGWHRVDHDELNTVETYGMWYGPIVDSYILSMGVGFVGTSGSTMSLLAQYRVRDWRAGAIRSVRWGRKNADAHRKRNPVDDPEEWWA